MCLIFFPCNSDSSSQMKINKISTFFVLFIIWLIRFYQITLGCFLPRVCRFEPSCSNYAIDALRKYGLVKGGLMSILRILRCNPFSPGGYDPVVKDSEER